MGFLKFYKEEVEVIKEKFLEQDAYHKEQPERQV